MVKFIVGLALIVIAVGFLLFAVDVIFLGLKAIFSFKKNASSSKMAKNKQS